MTFVVTEACIRCKYTDCVDVCPVDAFRKGPNLLVIDPAECIDCALCVPECPVEAIYAEDDVPSDQQVLTPLNAELARVWKPITRTKAALPDAEEWAKVDISDPTSSAEHRVRSSRTFAPTFPSCSSSANATTRLDSRSPKQT